MWQNHFECDQNDAEDDDDDAVDLDSKPTSNPLIFLSWKCFLAQYWHAIIYNSMNFDIQFQKNWGPNHTSSFTTLSTA